MVLWPVSSLSLYVSCSLGSLGCKPTVWPSYGPCHLSGGTWSPHLDAKSQFDHPTACVISQRVCDLLTRMQNHNLTILPPVSSFRRYVIPSLGWKSQSDHPVACVTSQFVCDLLTWMQNYNLTILWPLWPLSLYVISSLGCKITIWSSCGLCDLSVCMWSPHLDAKLQSDHPLACVMISSLKWIIIIWPSHHLHHRSGGKWSSHLDAKSQSDHLAACVTSWSGGMWSPHLDENHNLIMLWPVSHIRRYMISSIRCKITIWPSCHLCHHLSGGTWSPHLDKKNHNLTILWPVLSLSGYVISSLGCEITIWPSCGLCPQQVGNVLTEG